MKTWEPNSVDEIVRDFPASGQLVNIGGGTKTGLAANREVVGDDRDIGVSEDGVRDDEVLGLQTSQLNGICFYEPTDFVMSALAGTPLVDVSLALQEHGQYLPFDPLFIERGSTVGGAIAAGLNGPGRCRYGGLRDFVLGVQIIDGNGMARRGGGRVVKNAAGFDLPKLVVGSCGWYGAVTEVTLKVFPKAQSEVAFTAELESDNRQDLTTRLISLLDRVGRQPFDIDAAEFEIEDFGKRIRCYFRFAGEEESLVSHAERVAMTAGIELAQLTSSDANAWRRRFANCSFNDDSIATIKVPCTPARILELEKLIAQCEERLADAIPRRYGMLGQVLWLGLPAEATERAEEELRSVLQCELVPSWLRVVGQRKAAPGRLATASRIFAQKIKQTLDPDHRWRSILDECDWGQSVSAVPLNRPSATSSN